MDPHSNCLSLTKSNIVKHSKPPQFIDPRGAVGSGLVGRGGGPRGGAIIFWEGGSTRHLLICTSPKFLFRPNMGGKEGMVFVCIFFLMVDTGIAVDLAESFVRNLT